MVFIFMFILGSMICLIESLRLRYDSFGFFSGIVRVVSITLVVVVVLSSISLACVRDLVLSGNFLGGILA